MTGTARYASAAWQKGQWLAWREVNAHRGIEQSRRDDIEAIGAWIISRHARVARDKAWQAMS